MFSQTWKKQVTRFMADDPSGGDGGDGDPYPYSYQAEMATTFERTMELYKKQPNNPDMIEAVQAAAWQTWEILGSRQYEVERLHPQLKPFAQIIHNLPEDHRLNATYIAMHYFFQKASQQNPNAPDAANPASNRLER